MLARQPLRQQAAARSCRLAPQETGERTITWNVSRDGSAAYAIRPPSACTWRSESIASAVISSPGASTGTPGG
jgi:hypothetical protein